MREVDNKGTRTLSKAKVGATIQKRDNVVKNSEKPSAKTSVGRSKEPARETKGKNNIVSTITKGAYNGR